MKYVAFILWLLMTPVAGVSTGLFMLGFIFDEWLELGTKILDSK